MENEIIVNWVTYVKKEDNQKKQSKRGDGIWFIDTNGDILNDDKVEEKYKPFCYPTKAEAIKARDKQLALYRIKEYCNEKRGEFIPDWNREKNKKYYIMYNHREKWYEVNLNEYMQKTNSFYLAEEEHCNEIIEKFKDDLDILFDIKWKQ